MGKKNSNPTRAHLGKIRSKNKLPYYCIECGEEFNTISELNEHKHKHTLQ